MRRLAVIGALGVLVVLPATPAGGTFAGHNGRIVFERFGRDGPIQIASISKHGHDVRTLTDYKREAVAPDVSPNGGRIAFTLVGSRRVPDKLMTMRLGGADAHAVTHGCTGDCLGDGDGAWSPDGRRLVFNRAFGPVVDGNADHIDLMAVNRNGTHLRTLIPDTANQKRHLETTDWTWSPDGTQLAATFVDLDNLDAAIYTVELDSHDMHRVTPWRLNAGNADYSPDGRRIVFNSSYEGKAKEHASIYTIAPDGTALRRLTHPGVHYTAMPNFSPSGNQIVYAVFGRHTITYLARRTIGGETHTRITPKTARGIGPFWAAR